jgi:hypothetical protein
MVTTKGALELPSPETLVAFVVDTNDRAHARQKDPPTLPFTGDTAAVAADSDQDTYETAVHLSDALNFPIPTDQQSESKVSQCQEYSFVTESDQLRQEQPPITLSEESDFIDGNEFDKNTTLEGSDKKSALELPSPEKLGIIINRLDIESFDKGIIPGIPYLDDDEPPVDEPINMLTVEATSLQNDETTETDTTGKPSLSAKNHNFNGVSM